MTNLDINNILYCRLDGLTRAVREQKRVKALAELGLLALQDSWPILEEATQSSSDFLDMPIALLSIFVDNQQMIKSLVGLTNLGFNQELVVNRQIPPAESFCIHVVDSLTALAIENTLQDPFFCQSLLTQHCGIRSYLGVPLITDRGECIGTLAVMDLQPRRFTTKNLQFLTILARSIITQLINQRQKLESKLLPSLPADTTKEGLTSSIKLQLLAKLIEELRTPLTAVMGMTGILQQQIYGVLTPKQQEYLEVIHHSGQRILERTEEIIALDVDSSNAHQVNLVNVDMEMLGQQVINNLQGVIQDRQQQVHLSIQKENRLWLVDRLKIRQMLYYLVAIMVETLPVGSQVKIHIDRHNNYRSIRVISPQKVANLSILKQRKADYPQRQLSPAWGNQSSLPLRLAEFAVAEEIKGSTLASTPEITKVDYSEATPILGSESWHRLGLLLSGQLAEIHGGKMLVQDSEELGYGYLVILPQLEAN